MEPEIVIGISGPAGAGKDTLCQILQILLPDACLAHTGKIIAKLTGGLDKQAQQAKFLEMKAERGRNWLHEPIREAWGGSGKTTWVLNSVRMIWDAEWVESFPNHMLIFVDAPEKIRFGRAKKRATLGGADAKADEKNMTYGEFLKSEQHETARAVYSVGKRRGVIKIKNDKTPKGLGAQIIAILLNKKVITTPDPVTREKLRKLYRKLAPR